MAKTVEKRTSVKPVQPHKDWNALIRSIRRGRAPSARFFKPVCVIAAIDLTDRGRLVSDLLHSELIVRQFADYVEPFFPQRVSSGWQPLWFLSNDGLWTFYRKGKSLDRASFENGMPRTKKKLFEKIDSQMISAGYKQLWDAPQSRKELRDQMLLMLDGDAESNALVAPLLYPDRLNSPETWPNAAEVAGYLETVRGQYDLFASWAADGASNENAALGVAADACDALAAFDVDAIPAPSVIGPEFEASGTAPIALTKRSGSLDALQRELCALVQAKAAVLRQSVPLASNRTVQLRMPVEQFAAAIQGDPDQANVHVIWAHGNTLRRLNDADLRARASSNPDVEPLPEDIGELLSDLVEQFNVYAQHDPLMRQLDNARIGPAGRAELLERLQAGRNLVAAAQANPQILMPEASDVLATATQTAEQAVDTSGLNADQAIVNTVEMQRNGARAMVRSAVLEFKRWFAKTKEARKTFSDGALKEAGAEVIKQLPFVQFVNGAARYFRELWKGQDGAALIERLLDWFRSIGS